MPSFVGESTRDLPSHPLMPEGHEFSLTDEMMVTEWGDVLPSVEFSRQQLEQLARLSISPQLSTPEDLVILGHYLQSKLTFDDTLGCWKLPLMAEYDQGGRARYPQVNIKALGFKNFLAHRATAKILGGQVISDETGKAHHIDHLCRVHACCNPYHLEAVLHAENVRRGSDARRRQRLMELFQLPSGQVAVAELVIISGSASFTG